MGKIACTGDENSNVVASSRGLHQGEINRGSGSRPGRRGLTPEQKQRIKELYNKTGNGHKVAQIMGLGSTTVYKHLGLNKRKTPSWTDDEIQILVDGYMEKRPVKEIAKQLRRPPRAVTIRMCRYRKQIRKDPKKRRALSAITLALKAVRRADIFREVTE